MVAGRPTRALLTLCAVRLLRRPRGSVLPVGADRMPAPKRKSLAKKGNAHAKKQQVGHGQSFGASNSNEPMDGATREPMRTAVPIRPTPPASAERCLCRAAEPLTHPMASQERTLDFGRALCGLRVELPYAGWGGEYAQSTQVAMGMVIKYDGRYQLFDIFIHLKVLLFSRLKVVRAGLYPFALALASLMPPP